MHSVRTGFGIPSVNRYVDVSTSNFCGLKFRSNVVVLPTNKNIKLTSVGFVRFTWLEKNDDQGDQEVSDDSDDDSKADGKELTYEELSATIRPVEQGKRYTTPPTVWIGVLPEILGADLAYESAQEILGLLK
jgi:hypothetical protein